MAAGGRWALHLNQERNAVDRDETHEDKQTQAKRQARRRDGGGKRERPGPERRRRQIKYPCTGSESQLAQHHWQ